LARKPLHTVCDLTDHLTRQGLEPRKFPERLVLVPTFPFGLAGKVDRCALQTLAAQQADHGTLGQ
jgi:non-ribosomal peptide synthetase component E (peptide arylation enzyme)